MSCHKSLYQLLFLLCFEQEFHINLEEFQSECDCWKPFVEDDVQFEFVRLDPFIRRFMTHDGKGRYSIRFTVE